MTFYSSTIIENKSNKLLLLLFPNKTISLEHDERIGIDELTMKEGDIIVILSKEGDWWIGELNGKTGQFPSNYVTLL